VRRWGEITRRIDRLVQQRRASLPALPAQQQWLRLLEFLARGAGPEGQACREAAAVLRECLESGRAGCHVVYHCSGALVIFSAWYGALSNPHDHWHGAAFPFMDEAEKLRLAIQIDSYREGRP
jgi:hypothetical protein